MPAYVDVKSESDKNDKRISSCPQKTLCVSLLLLRSPKDSFTSTMHNIKNDIPHSPQRRKYKKRPHTSSEVCFLAAYVESLFLHTLKYWL